ncbi:histone deacetylase complex subunit SAP25 [Thomomys bottae]
MRALACEALPAPPPGGARRAAWAGSRWWREMRAGVGVGDARERGERPRDRAGLPRGPGLPHTRSAHAPGMLSRPSAPQGPGGGGAEELGMRERGREATEEPGEEEEDVEEPAAAQEQPQEDAEEQDDEAAGEQGRGAGWGGRGHRAEHLLRLPSLHLQTSGPVHLRAGPWVQHELLLPPRCAPHLGPERPPATPVPPPQMAWEVTPSRTAVLSPWDPNYEAKTRSHLTWGPSCGSGASFSNRTMSHPSFYPIYEAAGRGYPVPAPPGGHHHNGQPMPRDAGVPVMCREDFFLLDPLLPRGQRVPLYLGEPPQQAMGPMKLLVLPPVMTPWVYPSAPQGSSTTAWLSGPELIALTGLLQMSQGEQRPSASEAPPASASLPEPDSNSQETSGGQSCCDTTDPPVTQDPDSHCP